jgi:hypothetical protein
MDAPLAPPPTHPPKGGGQNQAWRDALQHDPLNVLHRLLEERRVIQRVPRQRLHLHAEIRVVLRDRPQREDQVMRIDRRELAGLDPCGDDFRLFLHQRAQLAVEFVAQQRRALDHFKTEQPRRIGPIPRDHQLAPDVVANGLARVLLGTEAAQRFEPQREQVAQHVHVQLFLVRKVIEQVALRHVGARRHLVDRCAMQPEAGEQPQRGTEDRAALVLDLAQPPVHGGRTAHRGLRSLARRLVGAAFLVVVAAAGCGQRLGLRHLPSFLLDSGFVRRRTTRLHEPYPQAPGVTAHHCKASMHRLAPRRFASPAPRTMLTRQKRFVHLVQLAQTLHGEPAVRTHATHEERP